MTTTSPLPPELVHAHASALRRLAYSLTNCRSAADDVVQETWLRAMKAPRMPVLEWRAWLRTVLKNVVASRHRAETRRARRERDRPTRSSPQPESPLDLLERRETLRSIMGAVMRLDEELQEVVFLRHFDQLAPRDIATQLGLPIDLVYRRLKLARDKLRTDLGEQWERRNGKWQGAVLALFGRSKAPWFQTLSGVILMTLNTKLAISAGALMLLVTPMLFLGDEPDTMPHEPVAAIAEREPDSIVGEQAAPTRSDVEETTVTSPLDAAAAPLEPYEYTLVVTTFDQFDLPTNDVRILAGPSLHELNSVGKTDADGRLELRWRARTPAMHLVVASLTNAGALRRIEMRAGKAAHIAFQRHRAVIVNADGLTRGLVMDVRPKFFAGQRPKWQLGADGFGRFVSTFHGSSTSGTAEGGIPLLTNLVSVWASDVPEPAEPPRATIVGHVLRSPGDPDGPIHVYAVSDRGEVREVDTDEQGNFTLGGLTAGEWHIRAGGNAHGIAEASVICEDDSPVRWSAQLDRGNVLAGRLVDRDGKPLAGWRVRASSATRADAYVDETVTASDGTFAMPNAPARAHDVLFFAPSDQTLHPPHLELAMWPTNTADDVEIDAARIATARLRFTVSVSHPSQLRGLDARLWNATGHGFEFSLQSGELDVEQIPPGDYRLQIGGGSIGWSELLALNLEPGRTSDLGEISLAPPGHLLVPDDVRLELARVDPTVVTQLVESSRDATAGAWPARGFEPSEMTFRAASITVHGEPVGHQYDLTEHDGAPVVAQDPTLLVLPEPDPTITAPPGTPLCPGRYFVFRDGKPTVEITIRSGQTAELD